VTTVQNIIDRAMFPMRDAAREFITDAELITYVNEAVLDIATRELLIHKETSVAITTGGILAAPTDLIGWRWIANDVGVEGTWLDWSTWQQYSPVQDADSDFFIVTVYDDKAHVWPVPPNGTAFTVGYFGLPAELTAVGNTIPLSIAWDSKLVFYVRARAYERNGDPLAASERDRYEDGLKRPGGVTTRNSPGELAFSISQTVFDDDPDARHR
jgi:hypothetical protein